ncbi:DUF3223 domain-containing protein [Metapseudomonas furukawaii]|uniref:DUF3223 domain-containing protein n=1 Tax=Metapseudomonas furukawaii TaxID=1149133 RepID=UPI00055EB26D|nr:DUF3223 domain-containing protein [Pseudomonas furukawaii]
MPYLIGDEFFDTKELIKERCRQILAQTPDGYAVEEVSAEFLLHLFQHHDEWEQKSAGGVDGISTQTTVHGTRCFVLRKPSAVEVDISFPHAVRLLPSSRTAKLMPQALRDFRAAARTAIKGQIHNFRDQELLVATSCPITGEQLSRSSAAVDHIAPDTFDQLLFRFCLDHQINPLKVRIGSLEGVVATFEDQALSASWQGFHQQRAQLRLISRLGNLKLSKLSAPWDELFD